jgi:hypothetical protein
MMILPGKLIGWESSPRFCAPYFVGLFEGADQMKRHFFRAHRSDTPSWDVKNTSDSSTMNFWIRCYSRMDI